MAQQARKQARFRLCAVLTGGAFRTAAKRFPISRAWPSTATGSPPGERWNTSAGLDDPHVELLSFQRHLMYVSNVLHHPNIMW